MFPEYSLPDLWVHQLIADQHRRNRRQPAISDEVPLAEPVRLSWWRRAFALIKRRESEKRIQRVMVADTTSAVDSRA